MRIKKQWFIRIVPMLGIILLFIGCSANLPLAETRYPREYDDEVEQWAETYGLDSNLVYAVIYTESGFDPNAISDAQAIGLMQMTSDTFDWVKSKIAREESLTFEDLYTPEQSIRFGSYFLSYCMEKYAGDVSTAAAAYHSGMGTVDELLQDSSYTENGVTLQDFPYPQMNNYVYKINKNYETYQSLYPSEEESTHQV